jgi:hypothetical protein
MYICIYLSPILSWIFAFWIASKKKKKTRILSITLSWLDLVCVSIVREVLLIPLFLFLSGTLQQRGMNNLSLGF